MEKYELLAKQAGNEDPFFLKAVKRAKVYIHIIQIIIQINFANGKLQTLNFCSGWTGQTRRKKN